MNVELLRKIAAVIQEKPTEFAMGSFNICGTVHCIGGWAYALLKAHSFAQTMEGLGIDDRQWDRLCYPGSWPAKFRRGNADGWSATAKQAAARIEHFIATEGRE